MPDRFTIQERLLVAVERQVIDPDVMERIHTVLGSAEFKGLDEVEQKAILGIALTRSSNLGHLDLVDLFLDRGADIETDDGAPLRSSAINDKVKVVAHLLKRGANPRACDDAPLFGAIAIRSKDSITTILKAFQEKDLEEVRGSSVYSETFPLIDAELESRRKKAAKLMRASAEELSM
jgi:hypothetical protein